MNSIFERTIPTAVWLDSLTVESKVKAPSSTATEGFEEEDSHPFFGIDVNSSSIAKNLAKKKTHVNLLEDVSLLLNPGELCLVLGSPMHVSTLLLNELTNHDAKTNNAHYSSLQSSSQLIYCSQDDFHYPYFTVLQTLDLDLRWKFPKFSKQERFEAAKELLEAVGMLHVANTRVGDEFFRGVSGGEKRRLSLLEALIAGGSVNCFDNATRGLDSSTAGRVLDVFRSIARKHGSIFITTLYQGSQEVYDRFDKILILHNGRQIYFGPANKVRDYFGSLGYHPPDSKQTAMELVDLILDTELTSFEKESILGISATEKDVPRTPGQFALAWKRSDEFRALRRDIEQAVEETKTPSARPQGVRLISSFRTCFRRNFGHNLRRWPFYAAQLATMLFLAICIGTLFLRLEMTAVASFSRGSVIFFSLLLFTFMAVAEVVLNFGDSLVITRQSCNYSFYTPWVDSLSDIIAGIPFKLGEVFVFLVIFYFLVNLNATAGGFFSFYLFLALATLIVDQFYHMLARLSPTMAVATSLSGLALLWLAMYASYVVQQDHIVVWFKYWLMYTDPLMYAFESLITTQLHHKIMHCNHVIPSGNAYYDSIPFERRICAWHGASLGNDYVRGDDYLNDAFGYSNHHVWRNLVILIIFFVGFTAIELVGIQFTTTQKHVNSLKLVEQPAKDDPSDSPVDSSSSEVIQKGQTAAAAAAPGTSFYWQNLSYTLNNGTVLLDNVSGYVRRGELIMLMGASGAGKTTLLNALAGRYTGGKVTAERRFDLSSTTIGYVEQQEIFIDELTVQEALEIYAELQTPTEDRESVLPLLQLLGLTRYRNFQLKGLPLEQRKKVSLGIELVNHPKLLFVDEITSGLDDLSAFNIVKCLQNLARNANIAILCTVHQPSPSLITQFDRLVFLTRGGHQAYCGEVSAALDFFANVSGIRASRPGENPCDYVIEITGDSAVDWSQRWRGSREFELLDEKLSAKSLSQEPEEVGTAAAKTGFRKSYHGAFKVVLHRSVLELTRNHDYIMAKLGLYIVSGLFVGFSFYHVDHSLTSLQSSMFAIFLVLCVCSPLIHQVQFRCNNAKQLYESREFRQFHWSILPLCQVIVECPLAIVSATLSYLCFYFTWGINDGSTRAGYFYLDYAIMFQLYYVTFSIGVLYVSPNLLLSDVYASLFFAMMVVFCGAMQPYSMIPAFWKYTVYYESPFTYFLENLMTDLFQDRLVVCQANEFALLSPQGGVDCGHYLQDYIDMNGGYILNPEALTYCTFCTYRTGQEFTNSVNMYFSHHWRNFGILWVFIVGNVVVSLALYRLLQKYRARKGSQQPE